MTDETAAPEVVKVKFLADYTVQDENALDDAAREKIAAAVKAAGNPAPKFGARLAYKKGDVKTFTPDSASHFVRKGLAEVVAAKGK